MLSMGCMTYLFRISKDGEHRLQNMPMFRDFLDVFLKDLSRFLPEHDMEFTNVLVRSIVPMSKALHQMVPMELHEIKEYLYVLTKKEFIQLSTYS